MIPALFAILSVIGAWTAWRHNPLYSARSTVRSAAVVLLAIAAMVGIIIAAVNLTINRSPTVMGGTMAAVIIFSALSMIFIIQAVSTPPAGKLTTVLPPSAKLVHVHRKKFYKLAKFFAILLACLSALAIAIPGDARYAPLAIGGIALLLAVVLLPVMYVTTRNFDRSLTALELDPWVHWQFTPAQWKQWIDAQVERTKTTPPAFILKRDWRKLAGTFAVIAVGVFVMSPGSQLEKALYILLCCGLLFALVELSVRDSRHAPEKLKTALLKAAAEVYFGHDGVFCDGVYTNWLTLNIYLTSATIDPREPRSLLFRFEKAVPAAYGGNPIMHIQQSVLIPPGAESDIARLQQELTARCPKAQIVLL
jgi:hypothetical protein